MLMKWLAQEWWAKNKVYETMRDENKGEPFTLHDGPPYANGDLHIGHALNKVSSTIIFPVPSRKEALHFTTD